MGMSGKAARETSRDELALLPVVVAKLNEADSRARSNPSDSGARPRMAGSMHYHDGESERLARHAKGLKTLCRYLINVKQQPRPVKHLLETFHHQGWRKPWPLEPNRRVNWEVSHEISLWVERFRQAHSRRFLLPGSHSPDTLD
ncbi:hypothetical protein CCP4SC76_5600008 [Gammaproteobacteria bacterium]